ncbi:MAG: zinc metallopeptidase [Erysipelotrichaceae bacterium]
MDILQLGLYIAAIVLVMWSQSKVQGAYKHFSTVRTENHLTGAAVARQILDRNGLSDVQVQVSQNGLLSDHFDPRTNIVNLSPKVYNEDSIASVAVAAHEVGHALQFAENYSFIGIRNKLLPVAIVSGNLAWFVIIAGLLTGQPTILYAGIAMLGVIALFQLVTLPVEFDASGRALRILSSDGFISSDESADAKAMLRAAAFTYVAALLATLLQIFRLVLLSGRSNRRN